MHQCLSMVSFEHTSQHNIGQKVSWKVIFGKRRSERKVYAQRPLITCKPGSGEAS
uniref:Uncharacterized protein n=1 Tax=Anguilla anguilla TaxID=7936 RepID=A0A0E9TTR7_ANGAN